MSFKNYLSIKINLQEYPLIIRNKIISIIKFSKNYYKLENQQVTINYKTAQLIFDNLERKV